MHDVTVRIAWMWIVPFVGTEPSYDEQDEADGEVGDQHVDPDLKRQWRQERKQAGRLVLRTFEQDTDAEVHERFREVDVLFAHVADRQRSDRQIGLLLT